MNVPPTLPDVTLRPAMDADRSFLTDVYASTRTDELALVPWTAAEKRAFLEMQSRAQDTTYRERYPHGEFLVIELHARPIGRLYVGRLPDQLRLVDIALLPEHRGQGIGSALIGALLDEADAQGLPVTLYVESWNRAYKLYQRLGFERVDEYGVYQLLRRPAPQPTALPSSGVS